MVSSQALTFVIFGIFSIFIHLSEGYVDPEHGKSLEFKTQIFSQIHVIAEHSKVVFCACFRLSSHGRRPVLLPTHQRTLVPLHEQRSQVLLPLSGNLPHTWLVRHLRLTTVSVSARADRGWRGNASLSQGSLRKPTNDGRPAVSDARAWSDRRYRFDWEIHTEEYLEYIERRALHESLMTLKNVDRHALHESMMTLKIVLSDMH